MFKLLAFVVVVAIALGLFVKNLSKFVKIAALGRPAGLEETWGERIASLMTFFFGQRKVVEEKRSWHHLALYWGFLILQVGLVDMGITGLFGEFGLTLGTILGDTGHAWLKFFVDWGNFVVGMALLYAFTRRLVIKPTFVPVSLDAMLILGAISIIVVTHFGHHVFEMAHSGMMEDGAMVSYAIASGLGVVSGPEWATSAPGGGSVLLNNVRMDSDTAHLLGEVHWWAHMGVVLSFLNYLPFSKHIHVLGSGPNILLRRQGQRGIMPKLVLMPPEPTDEELEAMEESDEEMEEPPIPWENWGVGRIEDFDWKSLIDNYACTECARCTTYCPAFATQKPLSPMHLIHDLKDEMKDRGGLLVALEEAGGQRPMYEPDTGEEGFPEDFDEESPAYKALGAEAQTDKITEIKKMLGELPPLIGGRIKDETLWSCTTCGACQEVCPVFIEHPLKILQMRTRIVLNDEEGRTPGDITRVIGNIADGQGNPWNDNTDRMAWAEGLNVPTVDDKPNAEWLLFVGCAGALDDGAKKTSRALVRILHAAGVDFAVLGKQEKCTGDTLRRLGAEDKFQELAAEQVELMNEHQVTKVIATCPHCFHVIKNEYPQFGGDYEVVHHADLIARLLEDGKLKVENPYDKKFTYHDSCYLGRWNSVYEGPRTAIAKSLGAKGQFVELGRNKEHGFCCGAGGGRMWVEEETHKRVNVNRSEEIVEAKVDAVAVGCPFCKTMISDGMKHFDKDEDIEVLDIAQVVAATLPPETTADAAGESAAQ
ncbi:putative iron-sulfur-binding reductase [Plesiocystis pacifica SIR-1]|uniref:Putative iron-sulfur-binding reductase n=1 Tax=Plesiocystis pacifica SIR-1 TaxID=391625 RepID=A6G4Y4_9BACT|nr:(Fe-S)-binding protein [Plesiocystis pacifica]EDM79076.1 putative iron-sulfur-binding reductase [Plesiocystis pacifica SIR-1]